MAWYENAFEGGIGPGLAVAGAVILAPTLVPVVGRILRPVAKTVIKTGMMLYRETLSGVGDAAGDLVAEARSELDEESRTGSSRRSQTTAKA